MSGATGGDHDAGADHGAGGTSDGSDSGAVLPFRGPGTPAAVLERVTVRRGRAVVLAELSLTIPAGAVTAIVGRSGAGKTSLLHTLNGLITPAGGTLRLALPGGGLARLDTPERLRRHRRQTATIFQDYALIDRLSALDNVLLGLADRRHPLAPGDWPAPLRQQAAEALAEVGLLHRALARADRLSGGERQRVGVARALVRQPSLLLADEPFASVDPGLVRQLSQDFRRTVSGRGLTLVVVLHQLEIARLIADQIIGLAEGRLAFCGPTAGFDQAAQQRLFS